MNPSVPSSLCYPGCTSVDRIVLEGTSPLGTSLASAPFDPSVPSGSFG